MENSNEVTVSLCEDYYNKAFINYRKYLDKLIMEKFGGYSSASASIRRSRAHLYDCVSGKRNLDTVRRIVSKLEQTKKKKGKRDIKLEKIRSSLFSEGTGSVV